MQIPILGTGEVCLSRAELVESCANRIGEFISEADLSIEEALMLFTVLTVRCAECRGLTLEELLNYTRTIHDKKRHFGPHKKPGSIDLS